MLALACPKCFPSLKLKFKEGRCPLRTLNVSVRISKREQMVMKYSGKSFKIPDHPSIPNNQTIQSYGQLWKESFSKFGLPRCYPFSPINQDSQ